MDYFEKGKTYTFEEIEEIYKNASAKELKNFIDSTEKADTKDPMFSTLVTMLCMQTMASLNSIMFNERENKESEEN